jgi:mono/diheme cytochrome c family protein
MMQDPLANFNVRESHEALLQEKPEPQAGGEALPVWVVVFLWLLVFWVGGYLIRYHGGFRADVFDEKLPLDSVMISGPLTPADLLVLGKRSFSANCVACHQTTGLGVPNQYPPLVGSEIVLGPPKHSIAIILHGLDGPVTVKGETYNSAMPAWKDALTDAQVAGIVSYIRSSWGNQAGPVTLEQVKALREKYKDRTDTWKAAELSAIPAES